MSMVQATIVTEHVFAMKVLMEIYVNVLTVRTTALDTELATATENALAMKTGWELRTALLKHLSFQFASNVRIVNMQDLPAAIAMEFASVYQVGVELIALARKLLPVSMERQIVPLDVTVMLDSLDSLVLVRTAPRIARRKVQLAAVAPMSVNAKPDITANFAKRKNVLQSVSMEERVPMLEPVSVLKASKASSVQKYFAQETVETENVISPRELATTQFVLKDSKVQPAHVLLAQLTA